MSHVFYAVFPSQEEAAAAISELDGLGLPKEDISFVVHDGPVHDAEELELRETDAVAGLTNGALIGAAAGFLGMGLVGLPMGFVGAGPLALAALGAVAGGTWGALGGALSSLGFPERGLEPLMARLEQGAVLVTVSTAEVYEEARIADLFRRHHAIETQRHVV